MSLLPIEEALARLLGMADADAITETERVSLAEAEGRVLALPVIAGLDLPPWSNSAMDGYALRFEDLQGEPLSVSQRIFAGQSPEPLKPGTCARIFTGAPMPEGADTVEMQENTEVLDDGRIRFMETLKPGKNVRLKGNETRQGDTVLDAGKRLGPIELGIAASLGCATLEVFRRPRVAILSTGDELVEPGKPLGPGQIYNSNRTVLASWLKRLGCEVIDAGILPDDLERTREQLGQLQSADLILSTGGVSVGEADFLGQALREAGELTLWKLALKPGKPLTCGRYNGVPVIGLPGNPASTLVTFGLLARPYLLRRMGVQNVEPLQLQVAAGFSWTRVGDRREYQRARLENGRVVPHRDQGSNVLRTAAWADGLVEVREGRTIAEGDLVGFIPMSELIG
ncbi:gephyrin-like molybdotransferase Glp [Pseudomonas asuensis]|uniref:Molybdopterin molybdenumtransferase n=1 Tax=Pseudomonas asuensis TaxID=1825787 RepID=A0ABQ2GPM2_9PSED|nr:gephyrin-like molybdotransferase Glp [Pseudomonas asuensis]GGM06936.1 molybdopterin molybdenumtransferase MoeA [Pseudomonas asuensis]